MFYNKVFVYILYVVWDLHIFISDSGYSKQVQVAMMDVPRLLSEQGYVPLKVRERVVAATALSSLSVLGTSSVRALLFHMSTLTGMQESELLSNYREFEKALWAALGSGADIILKHFSDELARNVQTQGMGVTETLDAMKRDEPYVFMRNTVAGDHTLLLYQSPAFRDRMLAAFFDPASGTREARAAVLDQQVQLPSVSSVTFADLEAGPSNAGEKIIEWASAIAGQGRLRFAMDSTWLVENNIEVPAARLKDAALLSACDLRAGAEHATKAVSSGYVVLEGTKTVYVK